MPKVILTDARVKALRPRKTAYDIRDCRLRGFGVRVLPSGRKRFFVHSQHRGERVWKIVGDAETMTIGDARSCAVRALAAIRRGEDPPRDPAETLFEAVAETVFERYRRLWKPGTLDLNRCYLRNQILPRFRGRQVADIDRRDVRNWFASLRATPVAADRSMPVLSVIMREAEAMGLRPEGSNPFRGIRRYRRKGRQRFLSDEEVRRLAARLSAHADTSPGQVAVVRLLLLTGCRKSEILTLRWSDYREGHLSLRDSKTGPRTVWLSRPARDILDGLDRTSRWVFPGPRSRGPRSKGWLERFWFAVRAEAALRDVRLHDLRHTHASIALGQGETVPAIGRLLGHQSPDTTLGYIHFADATVADAAERVGVVLEGRAMLKRERVNLTDRAIARLRPRTREYTVWDSRLVGLGVRVRPTGGRSYVLLQNAAGRSRRISLGPVTTMGIAEARRECHACMTDPETAGAVPGRAVPLFRDFVAGEWREARFERCKPSTKKGVLSVLESQLLPAFGSKPLDRITLARIRRWFDDFSRTAPGNASHALDLLRRIMNFAIACGHVDTNPAREVKPNPRPTLTRFLSREEVGRLHRVLDGQTRKGSREQADIIRLLLFTGCRRGEILGLRWSEVHSDALMLEDAKTGPRKVLLNGLARTVLERRPREGSPFVFPSQRDPNRARSRNLALWHRVRREAGIEDVRLHDLRHTVASHAAMNGVPLPVISRLLGHFDPRTTLRYAHLGDREIEAAAERVGQAIASIMDSEVAAKPTVTVTASSL